MYNALNYMEQGGEKLVIGGTLEIKEGATVTGLGADPLQPATADTLGGVKVGTGLSIDDGVLSADEIDTATTEAAGLVLQAANVAASEAEDVAGCVTSINAILTALKAAGIMAADADPQA